MKIICTNIYVTRKQKCPCWWSVTFGSLWVIFPGAPVPTLCVRLVCYWYFTFALYTSLVRVKRRMWCQGMVDASYWYHGCPAHVPFHGPVHVSLRSWVSAPLILPNYPVPQNCHQVERKQPCPGLVVANQLLWRHEKLFSCVKVGQLFWWVVLQNSGKH